MQVFPRLFDRVPQTIENVRATEQDLKAGPGRRHGRVTEAHGAPLGQGHSYSSYCLCLLPYNYTVFSF